VHILGRDEGNLLSTVLVDTSMPEICTEERLMPSAKVVVVRIRGQGRQDVWNTHLFGCGLEFEIFRDEVQILLGQRLLKVIDAHRLTLSGDRS